MAGKAPSADPDHRQGADPGRNPQPLSSGMSIAALTAYDLARRDQTSHLYRAPDARSLAIPRGYGVGASGVFDNTEDSRQVSPFVVFIAARIATENGEEQLKLCWYRDNTWMSVIAPREAVFSITSVIKLAKYGFPVTSNTARRVIAWLSAFETANLAELPLEIVYSHLGWQRLLTTGGGKTFVLPEARIDTDASPVEAAPAAAAEAAPAGAAPTVGAATAWMNPHVILQPLEGMHEIVNAYRCPEGARVEAWLEAVGELVAYPVVFLAIYASLAAPMLSVFRSPSFVIHLADETGSGKTTALQVAASVWGSPRTDIGLVRSWDESRTWIERALGTVCNLPLFLDETKRARNPQHVAKMAYTIWQGRGRGRGTVTGAQSTVSWNTVVLSTGEGPITEISKDGGVAARVVEVTQRPLGPISSKTRATVADALPKLEANAGTFGRHFLCWLLSPSGRSSWPDLQQAHREMTQQCSGIRTTSVVGDRLAVYVAALHVAGEVGHALGLPRPEGDPIAVAVDSLLGSIEEVDRVLDAFLSLFEWIAEHRANFWDRTNPVIGNGYRYAPYGGWVGVWHGQEAGSWSEIAIAQRTLVRVLRQLGFDPSDIRSHLLHRGWIRPETQQIGSVRVPCYIIRRSTVDTLIARVEADRREREAAVELVTAAAARQRNPVPVQARDSTEEP